MGSSFVVAVFVLLTMIGVGMLAINWMFNGKMTFVIRNGSKSDIANVRLVIPEFEASTGKLKPGEFRTYRFESHRECSANLEIEFSPSKIYKIDDLCYLDGMETHCEFLLLDESLEVRHRNPNVRTGKPGDSAHQGVGVCKYATGKFEYDENRD